MRIATLCLALFIVAASPQPAKAVDLTDDQRRRLEGGEVVVVNVLPPGGSGKPSQGGTALALTRAPVEAVWQVVVDYRRHSGLYPRVVAADVLEADAEHSLVRYVLGIGPFAFGFHVDNFADEPRRRLEWRLASERRNDLFRESWGYWQIEPDPRGAMVTYAMAARTVLPAFLTRGAERDGLVETLKAVRQRAEQAGGRYSGRSPLRLARRG
jgi:ribosome-associated toxin RatA of RatAB toxin-antitoxin module